ncbi:hypothetical protein [Enhygromyxa salina]|uniref:Uncharacterized protein n=1 Tax=Enhygromyxa salina TaxID=215803 RepID=A0A2S9XMD9_9BACT|nr:hypothetical protein [Enhygromyxa salina]PRP94023.1 hypothetical protein ENSA7_78870 [Enhygromyxa salina]
MRSFFARLALALGLAGPLTIAGCTAPPPAAESLPHSNVDELPTLDYRVRPDRAQVEAPPPEPEITAPIAEPAAEGQGAVRFAAGHPAHTRFAVSDGRRLWVGQDSAARELSRDDDTAHIKDMVMDAKGTLWLLMSTNALAKVNDHDGIEPATPLPVEHASSIHAGAGQIVVLGHLPEGTPPPPEHEPLDDPDELGLDEHAVMIVSPTGRDWTVRRRPMNLSEFDDLAIGPDGSLTLMDGEEAGCGGGYQMRWRGHVTERAWSVLPWPHDDGHSRVAATEGWSYGFQTCDEGQPEGLCAVDPAGRGVFVLDVGYEPYAMVHTEGVTMLASAAGLWSLQGREAARIGDGLAAPFDAAEPAMAISHTRVILVVGPRLYIGAAAGWTELSLG